MLLTFKKITVAFFHRQKVNRG